MGFGKVLAVIGAIVGLVSIILSLLIPELCWFEYEITALGITSGAYLTGIGTYITTEAMSTPDIAILMTIGGIIVIIGSILCIISAVKESKVIGIIGGVLMLLGPALLIVDLLTGTSEVAETISSINNVNIFWDSITVMGITASWNIWIGFFIALAGGLIGLIGGIAV